MEIKKEVRKGLNSFETSELERILEAVETQTLYQSGLDNICGGYANAEAYDIYEGEDYDDDKDEWVDIVMIEVDSGEGGCGYITSFKTNHSLSRKVLGDLNMELREKIRNIEEA